MLAAPTEPVARPRGLSIGHFRRIAERGFGDPHNSYAYSYTWFKNHVYIGSNRDVLAMLIMRSAFKVPFKVNPVPIPPSHEAFDKRGQVWRYSPDHDEWQRVFLSPLIDGLDGKKAPLAFGFRSMTVFQGRSDPEPALYTVPGVGRNSPSCVTLRSYDGLNYDILPPPRIDGKTDNVASYRGMTAFKGMLFTAPASFKGDIKSSATLVNTAAGEGIRCSDDPASGLWQMSSPPGFGDSTNASTIDMVVFQNHLYVGTLNIREGFQLWRTDGEGTPPHRWEKVLDRGADRGPLNEATLCMDVFNGALYIGTCIQNGGHDQTNNIGPAASEIIRVHPDGSWDLVVGQPRRTRQGFKAPTSGLGPGFDNSCNGYIWRICAHEGALYAGTFDQLSFAPYSDLDQWPSHIRNSFDPALFEHYMKARGGAELWRSTDGDRWTPITQNGFDNHCNMGIRTILSTPKGLFVGTANPFGPQVAIQGPGGWRFEDNPRGGLEIWHGSFEHTRTGLAAQLPDWHAEDAIHIADPRDREDPEQRRRAALDSAFLMHPSNMPERQTLADQEAALRESFKYDPFLSLAVVDKDLIAPNTSAAGDIADYFGNSGLRNAGYWREPTLSPLAAARGLIRETIAMLPPATKDEPARVAAAIGHGLDDIRAEALRSHRMVGLEPLDDHMAPASVDAVLCIEPAGLSSGADLPTAAIRALRPGGFLVCADFAGRRLDGVAGAIRSIAQWKADLATAGFTEIRMVEATSKCWRSFYSHSRSYFTTKFLFNQIDQDRLEAIQRELPGAGLIVEAYVFIAAMKPREQ